jgi:hypothetical protein
MLFSAKPKRSLRESNVMLLAMKPCACSANEVHTCLKVDALANVTWNIELSDLSWCQPVLAQAIQCSLRFCRA